MPYVHIINVLKLCRSNRINCKTTDNSVLYDATLGYVPRRIHLSLSQDMTNKADHKIAICNDQPYVRLLFYSEFNVFKLLYEKIIKILGMSLSLYSDLLIIKSILATLIENISKKIFLINYFLLSLIIQLSYYII